MAGLASSQSAIAGDYHSANHGYELTLPDGWIQIPDDVLQETMRTLQGAQSRSTLVYDAGFQLDAADEWLDYPYVLVQPVRLSRPVRGDELAEAVLAYTGMDLDKILDENISRELRPLLGDVQPGHVRLDKPNRRFFWEMSMEVEGVGPTRGVVAGHFGRDSLIQVAFYAPASEWDKYAKERHTIIESFAFDRDKAFTSAGSASAKEDTRQFLDGARDTFSSKGHLKAKGAELTMAYPQSWLAAAGERPNVVQKFVSESGRGLEMALILVLDLPVPRGMVLSHEDQRELFTPSELRGMLPSNAHFISAEQTLIDGTPAGSVDYVVQSESAGMKLSLHAWSLFFIADNKLVQIQFSVGGPTASETELSERMEEFRPLFRLMANSIVLPNQWNQAAVATPIAPSVSRSGLPYDDPELLILVLLVSLVVTWAVGLSPPLIIRYILVGRPLKRTAATWIAVAFSILFWLAFQGLNHSAGERAGSGVVWIFVFFTARWIMSRGYTDEPMAHTPASVQSSGAASEPSSLRSVPSLIPVTPAIAKPVSPIPQALPMQTKPEPKHCPNCRLINSAHAERCDCGYDFRLQTLERSHAVSRTRPEPQGIGGWLILPAIGMVLSPLLVCGGIGQNMNFLDSTMIQNIEAQYPTFRSALIGQTFLSAGFLIFQLFVAVSFFMKKPFVPGLMVTYMLVNIALALVVYAWTASIVGNYSEGITEAFKAVVVAAVWIPYFLISKRVKNTFV